MSVKWTCGHFTPCWRTCQQFAAISFETEKKYGLTHSSNGTGLRRRQCDDDADAGVSILTSYGENPHYVKLPIFSEFMENSAKFMKNSGLTKWTQNLC